MATAAPTCATDADVRCPCARACAHKLTASCQQKCPASLQCYSTAPWFTAAQDGPPAGFASAPAGCLCSVYRGWSGDDCRALGSPENNALLATNVLNAALFAGIALVALYNIWRLVSARKFKLDRMGAPGWTLLQALVGSLLLSIFFGMSLADYTQTGAAMQTNAQNVKTTEAARVGAYIFTIGGIFTCCAVISLAIQWLEVASAIERLSHKSGLVRLKYGLAAFEAVMAIVCLVTLVAAGVNYVSLVFTPFTLMFTVLYGAAAFKLRRILKRATAAAVRQSHNSEHTVQQYRRVLRHIQSVTALMFVTLILYIGFAVGTFFASQALHNTKPGQVASVVLLYFFDYCFVGAVLGLVLFSMSSSVTRLIRNSMASMGSAPSGGAVGSKTSKESIEDRRRVALRKSGSMQSLPSKDSLQKTGSVQSMDTLHSPFGSKQSLLMGEPPVDALQTL